MSTIQGVPIKNYQKQMAIELKRWISEPLLVEPKCVLKGGRFFKELICEAIYVLNTFDDFQSEHYVLIENQD